MIRLTDIHKEYQNGTKALKGVSLQIDDGEFVFLVGPSGSGKSTIIKLITAEIEATRGKLMVNGYNLRDISEKQIPLMRRTIGVIFQDFRLLEKKNVYENMVFAMRAVGAPLGEIKRRIPYVLELVGLGRTGSKKVRNFSLGMRQRLGIAVALAGSPDLLLLDEPANGLDPQGIIELRELILKLNREQGITVLISSHLLDELARLASWYGFMDGGRILRQMSAQELEAACRKSTQITVSDPQILAQVLDTMGLEYTLLEGNSARLYGTVEVTPLVCALAEAGCRVRTMTQQDESLESFYMNLVGGSTHG